MPSLPAYLGTTYLTLGIENLWVSDYVIHRFPHVHVVSLDLHLQRHKKMRWATRNP